MDHQMRMSLMPPIVEQTERDLRWMKGIKGSRTEPIAEGTTGRNRYERPTYTTGSEKIPTDPHMLYMWQTIEATNKRIAPQQQDIASLRKQMASVATHGMGVEERRKWMNNATRELADKYRYIQDTIQDTNLAMSRALNRNIRVGMKIDWQKGPEQFTE
jgi:chromosome segregation ATPase